MSTPEGPLQPTGTGTAAAPGLTDRRILVVEDDHNLGSVIVATLASAGVDTTLVRSGSEALDVAATWRPELVLLDIGIADVDGFTVLQRLRETGNEVPVVFLTARRAVADKVRGLEAGATDYLVKPFHFEELLARIKVALRSAGPAAPARLVIGDLVIDRDAGTVTRGNTEIHLSPTEFKVLCCLARRPGQVVTRSQLYEEVWAFDFGSGSAIIDTFLSRVRRKIDPEGSGVIETVRGFGFRLGPAR